MWPRTPWPIPSPTIYETGTGQNLSLKATFTGSSHSSALRDSATYLRSIGTEQASLLISVEFRSQNKNQRTASGDPSQRSTWRSWPFLEHRETWRGKEDFDEGKSSPDWAKDWNQQRIWERTDAINDLENQQIQKQSQETLLNSLCGNSLSLSLAKAQAQKLTYLKSHWLHSMPREVHKPTKLDAPRKSPTPTFLGQPTTQCVMSWDWTVTSRDWNSSSLLGSCGAS